MSAAAVRVRYRGRRRDGTGVTGSTTETPAALAERLHRARWREATVTDHATGRVVAEVGRVYGRRSWWAES